MTAVRMVFTLDYEIFGDGSGSTVREQVVPTRHLADVLELHGHRLTIFVETGQQIYFRRHGIETRYAPVETQIRELYARGHGVELHIHPMWFLAGPPVDGRTTLDSDAYDLSLLPEKQIDDIVGQSCAYLAELLAPVDSAYRPLAYRAGAWSMRRHRPLFDILARHGIRIDSSMAPGARFSAAYGAFDYRDIPMRPFWSEGPLLELPILTERRPLAALAYNNAQGRQVRRIVGRLYREPLSKRGRSRLSGLRDIVSRDYVMADFNMFAPNQLVEMIRRYRDAHRHLAELPVILIGHSKTTYNADALHELFAGLARAGVQALPSTLAGLADLAHASHAIAGAPASSANLLRTPT